MKRITALEHELNQPLPVNEFVEVDFCGVLRTQNTAYLLLHPEPLVRDSWQPDGALRFYVVPATPVGKSGKTPLFSYPRHVVSSCYTIEYNYVQDKIMVMNLGEYSVELLDEVNYG